jgi:hypothetical protein
MCFGVFTLGRLRKEETDLLKNTYNLFDNNLFDKNSISNNLKYKESEQGKKYIIIII